MNAPDKIYAHITPHLGLLEATAISVDAPGEQEYIRKDALLEWAKEGKEHYKKLMEDFSDEISFAAYNAFIEKLNSL